MNTENLSELEQEQLRETLIEGYTATREEDAAINQEWERATLENWPR